MYLFLTTFTQNSKASVTLLIIYKKMFDGSADLSNNVFNVGVRDHPFGPGSRPAFYNRMNPKPSVRILCNYCFLTHPKTDTAGGVCPQMKSAASILQARFAYTCNVCDGEGRFEKQVETKTLQCVRKYEQRWKKWMDQIGEKDHTAKPPERRVFKCEMSSTEVVCEQCHGEGKILRMVQNMVEDKLRTYSYSSAPKEKKLVLNPTWMKYRMQPTPPAPISCAICLIDGDPEEGNFKLSCGHEFHANCIFRWLKQNENCPICRHSDTFIDLSLVPPPPSSPPVPMMQRMLGPGISSAVARTQWQHRQRMQQRHAQRYVEQRNQDMRPLDYIERSDDLHLSDEEVYEEQYSWQE